MNLVLILIFQLVGLGNFNAPNASSCGCSNDICSCTATSADENASCGCDCQNGVCGCSCNFCKPKSSEGPKSNNKIEFIPTMSAEHIIASIKWQNFLASADSEGLQQLYPLVETMRLALLDQNITLYNEAKTAWLAQIAALNQADKNTFNSWAEANDYSTRF